MTSSSESRLRPHPSERFDGEQDLFQLGEAVARLAAEESGRHGVKQVALFKHGPVTVGLFLFDAGAKLSDHVVDGPVIVHALAGRLRVNVNGLSTDMPAGSLLRLAPGVKHDVQAVEDSQMLLTICIEGPGSHA